MDAPSACTTLHQRSVWRMSFYGLLVFGLGLSTPVQTSGDGGINTASDIALHISDGVLSPCGSYAAFLRKSTNVATFFAMETADLLSDQIWLLKQDTGEEILLVADQTPETGSNQEDMENLIQLIVEESLMFSQDANNLYFLANAWATSAALHVVDINSRTRTFLLPANELVSIIANGIYAGHLVVQQQRYFLGGGSYDWYWLFTSDGSEVGPIGDTRDDVNAFVNRQSTAAN
jgi:hypothetical protein